MLARHNSDGIASNSPSRKGSTAGTAVTHTYVHIFFPDDTKERRDFVFAGDSRKHSVTLQVVRSRDSVYEVIWEDEDLFTTSQARRFSASTYTSIAGPQNAIRSPSLQWQGIEPSRSTRLSKWSWEGVLEPYGANPSRRPTVYTTPPESAEQSRRSSQLATAWESTPPLVETQQVNVPFAEEPEPPQVFIDAPQIQPDVTDPVGRDYAYEQRPPSPEPLHRSPSLDRPPPSPYLGGSNLTPQERRSLLGKRKTSNLPPEEEHFTTHRDSLVLAHRRIFAEDLEAATEHVGKALAHGHRRGVSGDTSVGEDDATFEQLEDSTGRGAVSAAPDPHASIATAKTKSILHDSAVAMPNPDPAPRGESRGVRLLRTHSGKHITLVIDGEATRARSGSG